jgi:hypothetical protein
VRRSVTVVLTALVAALLAPVAIAHPAGEFDACLTSPDVDFCSDSFSYIFGDTVVLKGVVETVHARAIVLRRTPHEPGWHRVGSVAISDAGRMRFIWRTHRPDAVQDAPYRFRIQIPGHGTSDVVEAWVLFGE